ncbi:hypothetical protein ID866_6934 [Astraeus odoratus]|nr:hypothetical protein ID866_6934 [Astraeus odoratus]
MKDSLEELKGSELTINRIAILQRIHDMMGENPHVLDAFREYDGFLVLMHVLSTLPTSAPTAPHDIQSILECIQFAFMVISKALVGHQRNLDFFQEFVGYSVLSDACNALSDYPATSEKTLGCLLSLSFHDFGLVDVFITLGSQGDLAELDIQFLEYAPSFGTIRLPYVFKIAWTFMVRSLATTGPMCMLVYKIIEHLTQSSHHNLAVLNGAGVLTPLFLHFTTSSMGDASADSPSLWRRLLSKILKRLLEIGASSQDVRQLLQCTVKENGTLDAEMIELLRTGMKSRWPPHISLLGSSAVTKPLATLKALPATGFTATVSIQHYLSLAYSTTLLRRCGSGLSGFR